MKPSFQSLRLAPQTSTDLNTDGLAALDLLGWESVDVPDLSRHGHGVAVDDVEVLLPEQQQPLAGVQTLHSGTAVHVLDLTQETGYRRGSGTCQDTDSVHRFISVNDLKHFHQVFICFLHFHKKFNIVWDLK